MNDAQDLNRMRWRCRRGMRELDALLMRFVDGPYSRVSAAQQAIFQDFLMLPDPEILGLLTGRLRSEDPAISGIVELVLEQRIP
jgi:antitoxin CptB